MRRLKIKMFRKIKQQKKDKKKVQVGSGDRNIWSTKVEN